MTDVTTAATIASLRAEVERLKADNAFMRGFINNEDVRSDFQTATAMRQALDTARERAGVLEREVRAWRDADRAHDLIEVVRVHGEIHESIVLQQVCRETDSLNAIDNEQFGGGQ